MKIPVGLSNHHAHITREVGEILFGSNYELMPKRYLKQIGEFACEETVTLVINNKTIENVRLIGPYRKYNQVELLDRDCDYLGVEHIKSNSGEVEGTIPFTLITPTGKYESPYGAFIANNHVHLSESEREYFNVNNKDIVKIKLDDGTIINNIIVKTDKTCSLEFHINKDDGENYGLNNGDTVELIK